MAKAQRKLQEMRCHVDSGIHMGVEACSREPVRGFKIGLGVIRCTFLRNMYSYVLKFQSDVLDRASGTCVALLACM